MTFYGSFHRRSIMRRRHRNPFLVRGESTESKNPFDTPGPAPSAAKNIKEEEDGQEEEDDEEDDDDEDVLDEFELPDWLAELSDDLEVSENQNYQIAPISRFILTFPWIDLLCLKFKDKVSLERERNSFKTCCLNFKLLPASSEFL